jgi:hypothetical protein
MKEELSREIKVLSVAAVSGNFPVPGIVDGLVAP